MRDMSNPCVDPQLEEIYMNILIEKLEKPDEWKKERNDLLYISDMIPGTRTHFKIRPDKNKISIHSGDYGDEIHSLEDTRRIRKLIRKLHQYMKLKEEWAQYEVIDNKLKKGLPSNIDRYLKLTKIKRNI